MSDSILESVKKVVGVSPDDTVFDPDLIMHINSVLSTLNQLGIGPAAGFMIEDDTETWTTFLGGDPRLNSAKSYIFIRVRLLFDPPTTSFHLDALQSQAREFEWRLNTQREDEEWVPPVVPTVTSEL